MGFDRKGAISAGTKPFCPAAMRGFLRIFCVVILTTLGGCVVVFMQRGRDMDVPSAPFAFFLFATALRRHSSTAPHR